MGNWMPGAAVVTSRKDGGSMVGGAPRATEHVMVTPYTWSALQAARFLIAQGTEAHLTLHPISGHVVQIVPANRASRALANRSGGVETNRQGRYNIQTEVVAMPNGYTNDVTEAGKAALAARANWLDSLGIERVWAQGGPPSTYGQANNGSSRGSRTWVNHNGYFGHSQVPENEHWDPGPCNPAVMMGMKKSNTGFFVPKAPTKVGAEWYAPDSLSVSTIKALQKAVGVKADGVMGPATAKATQTWLKVAADGVWGRDTIKALQKRVGSPQDGLWGSSTAAALRRYLDKDADGGDDIAVDGLMGANTVRSLQRVVKTKVDGAMGLNTRKAVQRWLGVNADGVFGPATNKALQRKVGAPADGVWGTGTTKALQKYLNRVL